MPGRSRFLAATLLVLCFAGTLSSGAEEFHRLRFFLHPDLVRDLAPEEVGRRLTLYAEDLNTVFAKQTIRRFTFDPRSDVTVTNQAPQDNIGALNPPRTGFEIWAWVRKSDNPLYGTYGGLMGLDSSGAGVATSLFWDAIHDRATLMDVPGYTPELLQYWRQLHHLTHEIEHVFGAGIGEYYRLGSVNDSTGLPPRVDIRYVERATDPYWSRHPDFWNDPLLGWLPGLTYRELTNQVRFARLSAATVDAGLRDRWSEGMPDTRPAEIRVRDRDTGAPIVSARVRVWMVVALPAGDALPLADLETDEAGNAAVTWDPTASNYNMLLLVKAYPADGRPPVARWYSIFDAQEQRLVGGLTRARIDLEVPPPGPEDAPPAWVVPPEDVTARDDAPVVLHASVTGTPPLSFHWLLEGQPVVVTSTGRLERTNLPAAASFAYSVIVSNRFGTLASLPATLSIEPSAETVRILDLVTAKGPSTEESAGLAMDGSGNRYWLVNVQGPATLHGLPVRGLPGATSSALAKIDPAGRIVWLREIGPRPDGTAPGSGAIQGRGLGVDATGAAYVAGWFIGSVHVGGIGLTNVHDSRDVFLAKFAPDGTAAWVRDFGGAGFDDCHGLAVNAVGTSSLVATLTGPGSVGSFDLPAPTGVESVVLAQWDAGGNPRWALRTTGNAGIQPQRVALDDADRTYTALAVFGETTLGGLSVSNTSPMMRHLFQVDAGGQARWMVPVPSRNDLLGLGLSASGQLHVTGQDEIGRLFVAQYADDGNRRWIVASEGFLNDSGVAIAPDPLGNVVIAGNFYSNPLRFGGRLLSGQGNTDAMAAGINAEGRVTWALSFGGPGYERVAGVAVDRFGVVQVAGLISDGGTFGPFHAPSTASDDAFLVQLGTRPPPVPPRVLAAPALVAAYAGTEVTLSIEAEGSAPLVFAWLKDGVPVPGADGRTLLLRDLRPSQEGSYVARVTNPAGTDDSAPIRLRLAEPLVLRLRRPAGAGTTAIEFPTATATRYVVEHRPAVAGAPWQTFGDVTGDGTSRVVELPSATASAEFFRVRAEPAP